ncbi:hypothetical protein H4582DRAFT_1947357 [Lactarius indigo]|nr:hypothetical protein H4582DRAFT_1947357 [Lactarius indigo]
MKEGNNFFFLLLLQATRSRTCVLKSRIYGDRQKNSRVCILLTRYDDVPLMHGEKGVIVRVADEFAWRLVDSTRANISSPVIQYVTDKV